MLVWCCIARRFFWSLRIFQRKKSKQIRAPGEKRKKDRKDFNGKGVKMRNREKGSERCPIVQISNISNVSCVIKNISIGLHFLFLKGKRCKKKTQGTYLHQLQAMKYCMSNGFCAKELQMFKLYSAIANNAPLSFKIVDRNFFKHKLR